MKAATKSLYDKARRGLAEGDAGYWKAAEAMAELAEMGESQRAIGAELGVSHSTVHFYLRVWGGYGRNRRRPSFSEAMAEIRPESPAPRIPQTPDGRAELAAKLLKDKAVADAPAVRKVEDRNSERRLRQAVADANKAAGIPTRTEEDRDRRKVSVLVNRIFWRDLLWAIEKATRMLNDAAGELGRTGLPAEHSGAIIKAARALNRASERFVDRASGTAVGKPMDRGA